MPTYTACPSTPYTAAEGVARKRCWVGGVLRGGFLKFCCQLWPSLLADAMLLLALQENSGIDGAGSSSRRSRSGSSGTYPRNLGNWRCGAPLQWLQ